MKYPICPLNLYFEGDEDECDVTKCDYDSETRSCTKRCEIKKMREFESGATRGSDIEKLDYEGFLSPLVLKRYAEYLHKHRIQSDGQLRDADNWQKGIPIKEYMKSKARHFITTWLIHRKFSNEDVEESLCAEIFNSMGMLFEILKRK